MKKFTQSLSVIAFAASLGTLASTSFAQTAPAAAPAATAGPNKILNIAQTLNTGNTDYIFADSVGRRVYIPSGSTIQVFDLDNKNQVVGTIPNAAGHGVVIDPLTHHGFVSGNPSVMFDSQTLAQIKTNPAQGADGILFDPFNQHVYILSHGAPNLLVIDSKDGSIVGTVDALGKDGSNAQTEQGVTDGNGTLYFDVPNQNSIAVVDAKTLKVTGEYDLGTSGAQNAGLAIDAKNHILFAMCRSGQSGQPTCVILSATDGKIITTLPLAGSSDGGGFNPNTMEAFASEGNGFMTFIKENSPTDFVVEQNLATKSGAKCCSLDIKTNHFIAFTTEPIAPPPASAAASAGTSAPAGSAPAMAAGSTPAATPTVAAAPAGSAPAGAPAAGSTPGARGGRRGGGVRGPSNIDLIVIGKS